jgi:hypothetical protein
MLQTLSHLVKKDQNGKEIDFNNIYEKFIKPSIIAADLSVLNANVFMN